MVQGIRGVSVYSGSLLFVVQTSCRSGRSWASSVWSLYARRLAGSFRTRRCIGSVGRRAPFPAARRWTAVDSTATSTSPSSRPPPMDISRASSLCLMGLSAIRNWLSLFRLFHHDIGISDRRYFCCFKWFFRFIHSLLLTYPLLQAILVVFLPC